MKKLRFRESERKKKMSDFLAALLEGGPYIFPNEYLGGFPQSYTRAVGWK